MARKSISLNTLRALPAAERDRALAELAANAAAPRNGQSAVLDARIRFFEQQYEMTSAELHQRLRSGQQTETADVAKWLFLLEARNGHESAVR